MRLIILAIVQSILLCAGQVWLKLALCRILPFAWSWAFWRSVFLNWQFLLCGLSFAAASGLWMYILKNYPFSMVYPMVSLSYVFGMIAAILVFHENVDFAKWIGVLLIMTGCFLISR